VEACLSVLGFYLFLAHSFTIKIPFLDLRMFRNRNFFIGLIFAAGYGLVTTPPLVLMPAFLQELRGYPIDTIGFMLAPRGIGLLIAMVMGGRMLGKVDARMQMAAGLLILATSSFEMARWTTGVSAWPLLWTNFSQGFGGGIMLVPNQAIAFSTLSSEKRTEGAALYNLVRSVAASVGVSAALALFLRTSGTSRAYMTEHISPYSKALAQGMNPSTWDISTAQGLATLAREIDKQAAMFGYMGDFRMFAVAALLGLPLLLFVGSDADRAKSLKKTDVHFE
ncbi:MAG: MFS transporter, partial [Burkholderiales bacterium]